MTDQLEQAIETAWDDRATITSATGGAVREAVEETLKALDSGALRVAERRGADWHVNQWAKKAVLLGFRYAYDHFKEAGGGAIVINASYTASMSTAVLALFKSPGGGGSGGICAFGSAPPISPAL